MFSAVLNFGSNLIYGQADEVDRVPSTDGSELRRSSLVEKVDENWVIVGEDEDHDDVVSTSVPVRDEVLMKNSKIEKKRNQQVTRSSSRRKLAEMQSSSNTNYSPYIKSESHYNHNKRSRNNQKRKSKMSPIMQP